eukprot:TRINITY_DN9376_c0_g1_i2.p1 TRINITY_DN9376_c0_g1~~TRINITY_DN9376_c0_g1_i2.p1  ORF type:complete len:327 (-),score=33.24 TRINITY_DN9376_c0_g1_i2:406-1386(-)
MSYNFYALITGRKGKSGFSSGSTAEDVSAGIDLSGRTAIVTGGASGLGAETARVLALRGAQVIIAARNTQAAERVKDEIIRATPHAKVEVLELDLSSLASVKRCADQFLASGYPLNLLMNNAGVMLCPFQKSADGIEIQFATNHVGHFYLTKLLLDKLKSTAKESGIEGRIVNLSSHGHNAPYRGGIRFKDINEEKGYGSMSSYGQSKLCNILHANELARRLQDEGANVTANSLHPGFIKTNLGRHVETTIAIGSRVTFFLWKSIPQGASTQVYVAVHPSLNGVTGKYFDHCNEAKPSKLSGDKELGKNLWDFTEGIIAEKTASFT